MSEQPRRRRRKSDTDQPPLLHLTDQADTDQAEGKELYDLAAAAIPAGRINWLWPDRLEWGTTAMLQGEKGSGKSTWLRALAAHVTGGPALPGLPRRRRALGNVLWYAGEEDLRGRVAPALAAAGADLERVFAADCHIEDPGESLRLPGDCDRLTRRIRHRSAVLVVIDPVFAFVDGTCDLEGPSLPARLFMQRLARVAKDTGALLLLSRNLTKDTSKGAVAAGRGSGELGNAARAVLHAQRLPGSTDLYGLAVAICNAGRPVPTLTYRLADQGGYPVIKLVGDVALSADDLVAGEEGDLDRHLKDRAKLLLRSLIPSGEVDSQTVKKKAAATMISERTLQQAAKELGVRSRREGTRESLVMYWMPPKGGWGA
ncbi:MAG: helicase RepA family protein [Gemmataceae bacterium]|nr:helicase RepA family protein [Gemmataceae bacterium]